MKYEQAKALYFPEYTPMMRFIPPEPMPPMVQQPIFEKIADDCVGANLTPFQPVATRRMTGLRRQVINWDAVMQNYVMPCQNSMTKFLALKAGAAATVAAVETSASTSLTATTTGVASAAATAAFGYQVPPPPLPSSAVAMSPGRDASAAVVSAAATVAVNISDTTTTADPVERPAVPPVQRLSRRDACAGTRLSFGDTLDASPWPASTFRQALRLNTTTTSSAACVVISDDENATADNMDDVEPDD
jgi:hypothetical protein